MLAMLLLMLIACQSTTTRTTALASAKYIPCEVLTAISYSAAPLDKTTGYRVLESEENYYDTLLTIEFVRTYNAIYARSCKGEASK